MRDRFEIEALDTEVDERRLAQERADRKAEKAPPIHTRHVTGQRLCDSCGAPSDVTCAPWCLAEAVS